jgi:homoserine kinase
MQPYQEVAVAAPAQVANIFGYFDCAGFLCKAPPQNESGSGGVGDIITVQLDNEGASTINVEYLLRRCNAQGYWGEIEKFSTLADNIKKHPETDIIRHLAKSTLELICKKDPELRNRASGTIHISLVKCLPAGRVGVGLGSSASSTAVVVAIDRLFGDVLRRGEEEQRKRTGKEPNVRLKLMAEGERIASGACFFDNVAPLLRGGLVFVSDDDGTILVDSFDWPRDLHLVTITPDLSLETRLMRSIIAGKMVNVFDVSHELKRRAEIMIGLVNGDVERIIRFSNKSLIEDIRWPLIKEYDELVKHVQERREIGFNVSLGISGSGPTIYCLADSEALANQLGEELHLIWKQRDIESWWFVQEANTLGINVFHLK